MYICTTHAAVAVAGTLDVRSPHTSMCRHIDSHTHTHKLAHWYVGTHTHTHTHTHTNWCTGTPTSGYSGPQLDPLSSLTHMLAHTHNHAHWHHEGTHSPAQTVLRLALNTQSPWSCLYRSLLSAALTSTPLGHWHDSHTRTLTPYFILVERMRVIHHAQ